MINKLVLKLTIFYKNSNIILLIKVLSKKLIIFINY